MMKRVSVLLVALVLMSIPISVNAQTTEFQVTSSSVAHNADGFDVALTVNWYHVAVIIRVNGDFYEEDWFDGPNNTYLFFWFKYDHLGVDIGETVELTIELSNMTRVYMENDYALEHPECVLTFAFSVPWPEVNEGVVYEPPFNEIPPEADYEPWPDDVFPYLEPIPCAMLIIICFALLCCICVPIPEEDKKQNIHKLELKEAGDSALGVGKEYSGTYYAMKMSKIDMSNVYPYPEETMLFPDYETHNPPVTGQLPDSSSPDDNADWRICQWCGTWTHGEKTRCIYCDGRLGRPLGRNDRC